MNSYKPEMWKPFQCVTKITPRILPPKSISLFFFIYRLCCRGKVYISIYRRRRRGLLYDGARATLSL